MPEITISSEKIIFDACCIINLAPTGEFNAILETVPAQVVVASYVLEKEVISYINIDGKEIRIDLNSEIEQGLIEVVSIDYSQEVETDYVVRFENVCTLNLLS